MTTALVSGGKDSVYSTYLADSQGLSVDELLTIAPEDPDSFLFHTPNVGLVKWIAEAWGKTHRIVPVTGTGEAAETAALRDALAGSHEPVVAGAIASAFQWSRLHRLTFELGRPLYTPLWGKEAGRVVREEISAGLDIRIVQVAAEPLGPELVGRRLDAARLADLERLSAEVRPIQVAGEGGEYETLVVDAPFFRSRLVLEDERVERRGGATRMTIGGAHLVAKTESL
ncbi:MAG TPA: diphthine--ammonia ligase [Thermoplasmata archaeon]|nr:diphthine--ammonia ligase [Thermoplasmata archaeon]